jgi:hypothetical protein
MDEDADLVLGSNPIIAIPMMRPRTHFFFKSVGDGLIRPLSASIKIASFNR